MLQVVCKKDYEEASRAAADLIAAQILLKPDCKIGLATGSTPVGAYAELVRKYEAGELDFSKSAAELERLIRGLYPWPCAYTFDGERSLKIIDAEVVEDPSGMEDGDPGQVICVNKKKLVVKCGEGALSILKLQPEGKKAMDLPAFMNGNKVEVGDKFGA